MYGAAALWVFAALAAAAPPPEWPEGQEREVVLAAGVRARIDVRAFDPFGRPLRYQTQGLPAGATLAAAGGLREPARIEWSPGDADLGTHEVLVSASNDGGSSTQVLRLIVEHHRETYLVPGVSYTAYLPNAADQWGFMHGVSLELELYRWVHQSDAPGPALGRVYVDLDVLTSQKTQVFTELQAAVGLSLSFEPNPRRSYLLPYYGLELGASFARQLSATLPHAMPLLGVELYASSLLSLSLDAGYLLPLGGADFDQRRGVRARIGANISFW